MEKQITAGRREQRGIRREHRRGGVGGGNAAFHHCQQAQRLSACWEQRMWTRRRRRVFHLTKLNSFVSNPRPPSPPLPGLQRLSPHQTRACLWRAVIIRLRRPTERPRWAFRWSSSRNELTLPTRLSKRRKTEEYKEKKLNEWKKETSARRRRESVTQDWKESNLKTFLSNEYLKNKSNLEK